MHDDTVIASSLSNFLSNQVKQHHFYILICDDGWCNKYSDIIFQCMGSHLYGVLGVSFPVNKDTLLVCKAITDVWLVRFWLDHLCSIFVYFEVTDMYILFFCHRKYKLAAAYDCQCMSYKGLCSIGNIGEMFCHNYLVYKDLF